MQRQWTVHCRCTLSLYIPNKIPCSPGVTTEYNWQGRRAPILPDRHLPAAFRNVQAENGAHELQMAKLGEERAYSEIDYDWTVLGVN